MSKIMKGSKESAYLNVVGCLLLMISILKLSMFFLRAWFQPSHEFQARFIDGEGSSPRHAKSKHRECHQECCKYFKYTVQTFMQLPGVRDSRALRVWSF